MDAVSDCEDVTPDRRLLGGLMVEGEEENRAAGNDDCDEGGVGPTESSSAGVGWSEKADVRDEYGRKVS